MDRLVGSWISNPEQKNPTSEKTRLDFAENGQLTYSILCKEKVQMIMLTYEVEGDFLITDQPSEPKVERTKFSITPDDKLIMAFDNQIWEYIRLEDEV
jgi:hypothetical protein